MADMATQIDGSAGSSLIHSWQIQRRVVWALILREILTRYGRHNIGFLWLFVEPMLFTIGVTALWTATKAVHGSNLPIVAFAVTGYSSVLLWRNMPARCIMAMEPNFGLLYHRNVRPIDIYLARLILEAAGAGISFVVLVLFFYFVGWLELPEDVLEVMAAWLMLAWMGMGLAFFIGALSEFSEMVEKLWHPFQYLLFPLSGAGFLVDALPVQAQHFVLVLPMVHGVEMLREGYFGSQMVAHYSLGYMAVFNAVLTLLGLAQVRKVSLTLELE
jgi:ABC-2 type transport system permease protein/capsular polysaccharide transport system permease protein